MKKIFSLLVGLKAYMVQSSIRLLILLILALNINCADYDLLDTDPPRPVHLEIADVTDSSVTLFWTQSTTEDFKNYKVYYSTNDVVDTSKASKLADSLLFKQDTIKTVFDLDSNRHYYFRVFVNTHRNLTALSNTVDTITNRKTKGRLQLFPAENVTDSSISLRWSDLGNSGINKYLVYIDTVKFVDTLDTNVLIIHDDTIGTITGLKQNSVYYLIIVAYGDQGFIAISNVISAKTTGSGFLPASIAKRNAFTRGPLNQYLNYVRYGIDKKDSSSLLSGKAKVNCRISGKPAPDSIQGSGIQA